MRPSKLIGLLGYLVLAGLFLGAVEWLGHLVRPRLPETARFAFDSGRNVVTFGALIAFNLASARRRELDPPAQINPAGNQVLQAVWRDRPSLIADKTAITLVAIVGGSVVVLDLFIHLTAPGDEPLGFLAGAGAVAVALIPFAVLVIAVERIWLALRVTPAPPTPAPAP